MKLAVLLLLLGANAAAQQKCDEKQLEKLEQVLPTFVDQEDALATRGLFEACGAAMPTALSQALYAYAAVDPQMRRLIGLKVLPVEHALWTQACPGGDAVIIESSRSSNKEDGRRALQRVCQLDWLSSDEAARGGPALELAVLTHYWLRQHDVSAERARRFARAIAHADGAAKVFAPRPPLEEQPEPLRFQALHEGLIEFNRVVRQASGRLAYCGPASVEVNLSVDHEHVRALRFEPAPPAKVAGCLRRTFKSLEWPGGKVELRYRLGR